MDIKNLLISIIMMAMLTSCGKKEETAEDDEATNTAKKITLSDFSGDSATYDNSSSSSRGGVVYRINSDSIFYDNNPNSSSSSSSCSFYTALSNAAFEAASDGTYSITVNDMSVIDCVSGPTSATQSLYMYGIVYVNSNGNAVDLTGKTGQYGCSGCYIKSASTKLYQYLSGTNSSGNTTEITAKIMISESDGTACNHNSSGSYTSDCQNYSFVTAKNGSETITQIHKHTYKSGLTRSSSGTYYTGANIDFKYNNWTGTMTYNSDNTSAAPTYSATNGTDNVSGTFSYSSSGSRSNAKENSSSLNSIIFEKMLKKFDKIKY